MKKREIACVYVIADGDRVKIGSAWEPDIRWRRQVRAGTLVFSTPQHPKGRRIEAVAHQLLKLDGLRIKDEWFRADTTRAIAAIKRASRIVDGKAKVPPGVRLDPTPELAIVSVQISRDVAQATRDWVRERRPNMTLSLAVELGLALLMKRDQRQGTRFGQPPKCSWDQRRQVQEWRKREGLPVRAIVERIKERFGIEVSATAVTNYLRKPLGERPSDE